MTTHDLFVAAAYTCAAVGIGVVLLSFLMHIPGVYLRGGTWHAHTHAIQDPQVLWSWSDPPFLYPLRHKAASVAD